MMRGTIAVALLLSLPIGETLAACVFEGSPFEFVECINQETVLNTEAINATEAELERINSVLTVDDVQSRLAVGLSEVPSPVGVIDLENDGSFPQIQIRSAGELGVRWQADRDVPAGINRLEHAVSGILAKRVEAIIGGPFEIRHIWYTSDDQEAMRIETNADVEVDSGYLRLASTDGVPPSGDCSAAGHVGRMKVDGSAGGVYVCVDLGWVLIQP